MKLVQLSKALSAKVSQLEFSEPVHTIYNPLDYAWLPHKRYMELYGAGHKRVLFLGMNPGPYGMAQTGVPFGEIAAVRDWLGIQEHVDRPDPEHPKRPVHGFECARSEVSGRRFWGWIAEEFKSPKSFFRNFFVHNYCPLVFLEESGRNLTPDKLILEERKQLQQVCDEALCQMVRALQVKLLIGIGGFAEKRARVALQGPEFSDLIYGRLLHPSPASPIANRGWAPQASQQLEQILGQVSF